MIAGVPGGQHTLTVETPIHRRASRTVTLESNRRVNVEVTRIGPWLKSMEMHDFSQERDLAVVTWSDVDGVDDLPESDPAFDDTDDNVRDAVQFVFYDYRGDQRFPRRMEVRDEDPLTRSYSLFVDNIAYDSAVLSVKDDDQHRAIYTCFSPDWQCEERSLR